MIINNILNVFTIKTFKCRRNISGINTNKREVLEYLKIVNRPQILLQYLKVPFSKRYTNTLAIHLKT